MEKHGEELWKWLLAWGGHLGGGRRMASKRLKALRRSTTNYIKGRILDSLQSISKLKFKCTILVWWRRMFVYAVFIVKSILQGLHGNINTQNSTVYSTSSQPNDSSPWSQPISTTEDASKVWLNSTKWPNLCHVQDFCASFWMTASLLEVSLVAVVVASWVLRKRSQPLWTVYGLVKYAAD